MEEKMHSFAEIIQYCTSYSLLNFEKTNNEIMEKLQNSSATILVKSLQMVRLQKAVMAVGMFSIFEAILQDRLGCENGFSAVRKRLDDESNAELIQKLNDYQSAINVLKHGRGRSYDYLVSRSTQLDFKIKLPGENFFDEYDVSEVTILVDVDDNFVMGCAQIIEDVSRAIQAKDPDIFV
jgi:hypothetical protein